MTEMMTLYTLGDRLREARLERGFTLEHAAERVGVRLNTVWCYEKNKFRPSEPVLRLCAQIYDKPYAWFFGEEDEPQRDSGRVNAPESAAQSEPGTPDAIVSLDEVSRDLGARFDRLESYVRSAVGETRAEYDAGGESHVVDPVDVNEVAAAAGGGAVIFDETVVGRLWFRRDWLARHAIDPKQCNVIFFDRLESYVRSAVGETRAEYDAGGESHVVDPVDVNEVAAAAGGGAVIFDETVVGRLWFRRDWLARHAIDPKQCNVISVRGESMEPTLPDGCSILVDRSQGRRRRRRGRIFVLRTEDGLVVKRAGKDEEGRWQIVSDHPAWGTVPWADGTEIIGEVRWSAVTY